MPEAKCPECMAAGLTPRRIIGEQHYDQHGRHHDHSLETGDQELHCTNGHVWFVHRGTDCCGHKRKEK